MYVSILFVGHTSRHAYPNSHIWTHYCYLMRSPDGDKKGKIGRKTAVQFFQLRVVMQGQDCMHCFTVDPPESDILAHPHSYLLPASMHQKRMNTSRRSSSSHSNSKWNRHVIAYIFDSSKEKLKHWSYCRWGRASWLSSSSPPSSCRTWGSSAPARLQTCRSPPALTRALW